MVPRHVSRAKDLWGIGLKLRFIIVISVFFIVSYSVLSFLQYHYFEKERLHLIDQQIESAVSLLASSKISKAELLNIEKTDDIHAGF